MSMTNLPNLPSGISGHTRIMVFISALPNNILLYMMMSCTLCLCLWLCTVSITWSSNKCVFLVVTARCRSMRMTTSLRPQDSWRRGGRWPRWSRLSLPRKRSVSLPDAVSVQLGTFCGFSSMSWNLNSFHILQIPS